MSQRATEMAITHPTHSPVERLAVDKARAFDFIKAEVERTRAIVVGTPGRQSDRDRKADLALNALNPAPEMAAIREAALAFLKMPADAIGITPVDLAKKIKSKRDSETAALMAIDAYRLMAKKRVTETADHDVIDAAVEQLRVDLAKCLALVK